MFSMENRSSYEKLSLRESAKSLRKYGSTSRNIVRNENYVKHIVTSLDTLQGLALRYGVTMEQIHRANRLWASDSLFLREHLLIPVAGTQVASPSNETAKTPTTASTSQVTTSESFDEDLNEFLKKIDASIAVTKEEVRKSQGHSDIAADIDHAIERRKPATSRMKKNMNNNTSEVYSTPPTVMMSQGTKMKTSLSRYERQQDELFEL